MLPEDKYIEKFREIQNLTIDATNTLVNWLSPGQSEKKVADKYYHLLAERGLTQHWYPILVYTGEVTGKPISRRIHLPSEEIVVKENDIVFVDSTPMQATVWGNWCDTVVISKNDFFEGLVRDAKEITRETTEFGRSKAKTVGDLYDFSLKLIGEKDMEVLDPYRDIGHSIFQVPEGQTVDKTPMEDRLLLNEDFRERKLEGIISIEPQLGRVNPNDGKIYGAKIQEILFF